MLAIRLQRLGRSGYPTYRIAVQEAQRHPTSGRVVAYVGSYNPHTKDVTIDVDKCSFYLEHGAQPTPRVVKLLVEQKVKLPDWVVKPAGDKNVAIKNSEKLRKNQPKEEVPAEQPAAESPAEESEPEIAAEDTSPADKAE